MAGVVEVRRLVGLARYPAVACGSLLRIVPAISVCEGIYLELQDDQAHSVLKGYWKVGVAHWSEGCL